MGSCNAPATAVERGGNYFAVPQNPKCQARELDQRVPECRPPGEYPAHFTASGIGVKQWENVSTCRV